MYCAPICVVPADKPWARPKLPATLLTVATPGLDEVQFTKLRSCVSVLPSANVPVTENCLVAPFAIVADVGVTARETRGDAWTVTTAVADAEPLVAVMVALPVATAVTRPLEATVAMPVSELDQVTVLLLRVAPVPASLAESVAPLLGLKALIVALEGLMVMAVGPSLLVSDVVPVEPPNAAVIVTVPAATAANVDPESRCAMLVLLDVQVASAVMSCVSPPLKVPSAENALLVPICRVESAGETAMDWMAALLTVSEAWAGADDPSWNCMVAVPGDTPVALPLAEFVVLATVATAGFDELQFCPTAAETSTTPPLARVNNALNG